MRNFLAATSAAALAVAVAEAVLWVVSGVLWYLFLAGATGIFGGALLALRRVARRAPGRAIVGTSIAILGIQMTYVLVFPQASVAVALASIVVAALALTYAEREIVRVLMVASALVALIGVAAGEFLSAPFDPAAMAVHLIVLSTAAAAVIVTFTLLWQFATRLGATLEATRSANALLQAAAEDKTRFINTAAHELRTPLLPLQMQVKLLDSSRSTGLSDEQKRSVQIIQRNLARLSALVEDLLSVARLQSGQLPLAVRPVDVGALLREVQEDYSAAATARGLALSVEVQGDATAVLDPPKVRQVITNLVGNAMKFTKAGGQVAVRCVGDDGGVTVRVTDTGIGIAPADLPRLFQPFRQVHDVMQVSDPGSGLGLFIAKSFVEAHQGRIEAASAGLGHGTSFTVRLPRLATQAA